MGNQIQIFHMEWNNTFLKNMNEIKKREKYRKTANCVLCQDSQNKISVLADMTDPDYQGEIDLHSAMKVRKPKSGNQEIP